MGNEVNQMLWAYHWRELLPISFHLNSVSSLLCPFYCSNPTALFLSSSTFYCLKILILEDDTIDTVKNYSLQFQYERFFTEDC